MTSIGAAVIILVLGAILALVWPATRVQLSTTLAAQSIAGVLLALTAGPNLLGTPPPADSSFFGFEPLGALFAGLTLPLIFVSTLEWSGQRSDARAAPVTGRTFALLNLLAACLVFVFGAVEGWAAAIGGALTALSYFSLRALARSEDRPRALSAALDAIVIFACIRLIPRVHTVGAPRFMINGIVAAAVIIPPLLALAAAVKTARARDLRQVRAGLRLAGFFTTLTGIGLILAGLVARNPVIVALGAAGALFHVIGRTAACALLAFAAPAGQERARRGLALLAGAATASNLPPFGGFIGAYFIFAGLLRIDLAGLTSAVALGAATALVAVSTSRLLREAEAKSDSDRGLSHALATVPLALALLLFGALPSAFSFLVAWPIRSLFMKLGLGSLILQRDLVALLAQVSHLCLAVAAGIVLLLFIRSVALPAANRSAP